MPEFPKSQLPDDPEYWDGLAQRIRQDAAGPLAEYASTQAVWYDVLAERAAWFVAAAAAAMLIVWITLPGPDAADAFDWIERSLAPSDLAGTLISGSEPPRVDALMVQFAPSMPSESRR